MHRTHTHTHTHSTARGVPEPATNVELDEDIIDEDPGHDVHAACVCV